LELIKIGAHFRNLLVECAARRKHLRVARRLFYAWQDQIDKKANRYLIEEALKKALDALRTNEEAPIEYELDQDARDVVGAVLISEAILEKIANCSVFVADVTPVGTRFTGEPTPNANVFFELGYAWRELGAARCIMVLNRAIGSPDDVPFDLRGRSLATYTCDPKTADKESAKAERALAIKSLVAAFTRLLREML
jgi:hypothetical protein